MRELDRHRHQLFRLVAGVAEHHALIAGAAMIHALRDVGGLLVDGADHRAGLGIESHARVVVSDPVDRGAHDLGNVDVRLGGDLAATQASPVVTSVSQATRAWGSSVSSVQSLLRKTPELRLFEPVVSCSAWVDEEAPQYLRSRGAGAYNCRSQPTLLPCVRVRPETALSGENGQREQ